MEAQTRLQKYGPNSIKTKSKHSLWSMVWDQFNSLLVWILLSAAVISFLAGHPVDAYAIIAITLINAVIGFAQEFKADNAVKALKKMLLANCKVIRDSRPQIIPIDHVVPGDVVLLDAGDKVPADMYIVESFSLYADEAILTGESLPVNKNVNSQSDSPICYKGTLITQGRCTGVVFATGTQTEFGKIVNLISDTQEADSPLTKELDRLGNNLVYLILVVSIFVAGLFVWRGLGMVDIFMTVVSLGVSAIPEGLPIVITLTLALGVQALARKQAIVRKLNAVETLGATTVICTDKTGTLTKNEMTVKQIFVDDQSVSIAGSGYSLSPEIKPIESLAFKKLMQICLNCNNSSIDNSSNLIGDPTELAMKVLAYKAKFTKSLEIKDENVFTSERKMMTTLHKIDGRYEMLSKGAPEVLLDKCSKILVNGELKELNSNIRHDILLQTHKYSANALRVLGCAYKVGSDMQETEMVFVGLVAMIDPPRESVKKSLELVNQAQIDVKIITGDNAITAQAIGSEIGLNAKEILTGDQIDELNDQQLLMAIKSTNIFARTTPKHKFRIVKLLQESGEIVAVSGDGVNDAPALKQANVGVAMGIKGTEATQEVADIVLKDDNFSTIVNAISEGRRIYQNILSFVRYMLGVNFCTIASVTALTLMGRALPILPLQVLFINVATDALPALALGQTQADANIMQEPPRKQNQSILSKFAIFIIVTFILQTICNVVAFEIGLGLSNSVVEDLQTPSLARTMLFAQIVLFELVFVFVCKGSQFEFRKLFNDKLINGSVVISMALLALVLYVPTVQSIFKTVSLQAEHWMYLIPLSLPALFIPSIVNWIHLKKTS